jgi:hypothetical protein
MVERTLANVELVNTDESSEIAPDYSIEAAAHPHTGPALWKLRAMLSGQKRVRSVWALVAAAANWAASESGMVVRVASAIR